MILINMINTFKAINIPEDKKPIVICDIDLTFIRPIYDYNDVYHRLKSHFSDPIELDIAVNFQLKRDVNIYINLGLVKQTDKDGFLQMLDKINKKANDLTKELLAQGILTDDQVGDIKDIRLAGHRIMKRRLKNLSDSDEQF